MSCRRSFLAAGVRELVFGCDDSNRIKPARTRRLEGVSWCPRLLRINVHILPKRKFLSEELGVIYDNFVFTVRLLELDDDLGWY
jgi:hypothetical protein